MRSKAFCYCLMLVVTVGLTFGGCNIAKEQKPFMYLIFDASGSFQHWLPEAMQTAYYILDKVLVNPGAQVCVAIIDDHSYPSENVLLGPIQMSDLPLKFKAEKRKLLEAFRALQIPVSQQPGTDIQGALHRAAEYAAANPCDWIDILMFCDMQEEHNPVQYEPVRFSVPVRLMVFFMPQLKIPCKDKQGKKRMRDETKVEFIARQEKWRNILARYGLPSARYVTFYDPSQSRVTGGLASTSIEAVVAMLSEAPDYAKAAAGQAAQQGPPMPPPGMPQRPLWEASGAPAPPLGPPGPDARPMLPGPDKPPPGLGEPPMPPGPGGPPPGPDEPPA